MRRRIRFPVAAAVATLATSMLAAPAWAVPTAPSGGVSADATSALAHQSKEPPRRYTRRRRASRRGSPYINPFADPAWLASRIDMGVDWTPLRRLPVLAIGDAAIIGSEPHRHWPGGHIIWYRLLTGDHAGDIVYVAEHLTRMLPAGTRVHAGQQIATALPGYPWTEWGWSDASGSPRAAPCYREGQKTNSGREMARFMQSLGATLSDLPGPGTTQPSGRRC
jgi:murein DD-endopeptidase MepM/ murein hydrolase activator NlpD